MDSSSPKHRSLVSPSSETVAEWAKLEGFLAGAPVFCQPWWLEAVAPRTWDYAVVRRGPEIAAVLPFVTQKGPLGQRRLGMPALTNSLGPWLRPLGGKLCKQYTVQKELLTELIDALPPHDYFDQRFHYSIANGLPFHWKGFTQTTLYTYVLHSLENLGAIWESFDDGIRQRIERARKHLEVVEDLGIDDLIRVMDVSFPRQGLNPAYARVLLVRVDEACRSRNAGKMLFAVDSDNRLRAGVFIVWTEFAAYRLLGGDHSDPQSADANCLLLWEAIRLSQSIARTFDFGGSMAQAENLLFRHFGARQVPYLRVTRNGTDTVRRIVSRFRFLAGRSAGALDI